MTDENNSTYDYSKLVDEALDALPTVREPREPCGETVHVPVLEDEAEGKLLILALIDQLELSCGDQVARLLEVEPIQPKTLLRCWNREVR